MDEVKSISLLEFFIILAIIFLLIVSFSAVMRRVLKVEKRKLFSYNHVNRKHAKIDWTVRLTTMGLLIVGFFVNVFRPPMNSLWFLEPWFLLIVFILVTETARAVMEWKYAENGNAYKLTIFELLFIIGLVSVLYLTNFFGII